MQAAQDGLCCYKVSEGISREDGISDHKNGLSHAETPFSVFSLILKDISRTALCGLYLHCCKHGVDTSYLA